MMRHNCVIIGLGGVTCGGKSTLALKLQKFFSPFSSCSVINQDDYMWPADSANHTIIPEMNHANWDIPSAINYEDMLKEISRKADELSHGVVDSKRNILIVEGFLLYNNQKLSNLIDAKYFLTLTKEQCRARRVVRRYEPPDPPGYFDQFVWTSYESALQLARHQPDICFIDGSEDKEAVFNNVLQDVKHKLSKVNTSA